MSSTGIEIPTLPNTTSAVAECHGVPAWEPAVDELFAPFNAV